MHYWRNKLTLKAFDERLGYRLPEGLHVRVGGLVLPCGYSQSLIRRLLRWLGRGSPWPGCVFQQHAKCLFNSEMQESCLWWRTMAQSPWPRRMSVVCVPQTAAPLVGNESVWWRGGVQGVHDQRCSRSVRWSVAAGWRKQAAARRRSPTARVLRRLHSLEASVVMALGALGAGCASIVVLAKAFFASLKAMSLSTDQSMACFGALIFRAL